MTIRKFVVVGLGLIGGSAALGLKKTSLCKEIIGIARKPAVCEKAVHLGVVDRAYTDLAEVAPELGAGDLIFIAVPTLALKQTLQSIYHLVSRDVTVTDGASVKGSVRDDIIKIFGGVPPNVIPGHPIAGSEKSGIEAARADLYANHRTIITPLDGNEESHIERVKFMWRSLHAEILEMDVEEHDLVLGATSHLPHVIAFSLVDTLANDSQNENIFRYAAGGFRDFTRIASSDAIMWRDIMIANKRAVIDAIDLFSGNLSRLRQAIYDEDVEQISAVFTRAKQARDQFTKLLLENTAVTAKRDNAEQSIAGQEAKGKEGSMQDKKETYIEYMVSPGGGAKGKIRVPGDKSISHRSIMLGSLSEGVTEISGFLEGEDALATLQAFRDMGVKIEGPVNGKVSVHGVGLYGLKQPAGPLCVGNSGTSMRLLAGILAGQDFDSVLTGDISLSARPMNRVANPLREMGAVIETSENGRPPLKIKGGSTLNAIEYTMPMASAQVKSCLLLAGLYAEGETSVVEPAPTRDHTERMLNGFGYSVERSGSKAAIRSGGKLTASAIDVPADISSAAFFMVAAAITPGSEITLTHVGINPTRIGVINILRLMGANIVLENERKVGGEPVADICVKFAPLKGIKIPEDQVPLAIDEFPALLVAAACAEGKTILSGAEELRVKETDRIQAMAEGLMALGIDCNPTPDGIEVVGGQLTGGEVESFHDHRIAMSFTIAALRASGTVKVKNCANVATSFPSFTELCEEVGISLEVIRT